MTRLPSGMPVWVCDPHLVNTDPTGCTRVNPSASGWAASTCLRLKIRSPSQPFGSVCGLCWSWLWVACAGAAHMLATTTADTASNDNRHGLPLTLTPPIASGPSTGEVRAAEGHEPKPARCTAVAGTRSAPTDEAAREPTHRRRGFTEGRSHSRHPFRSRGAPSYLSARYARPG